MTKTFIVDSREYTVNTCTAIAATIGDTERQDALYVVTIGDSGEKFDHVVYGYEMPEDEDAFMDMCEDGSAWVSDWEDLETVVLK